MPDDTTTTYRIITGFLTYGLSIEVIAFMIEWEECAVEEIIREYCRDKRKRKK